MGHYAGQRTSKSRLAGLIGGFDAYRVLARLIPDDKVYGASAANQTIPAKRRHQLVFGFVCSMCPFRTAPMLRSARAASGSFLNGRGVGLCHEQ